MEYRQISTDLSRLIFSLLQSEMLRKKSYIYNPPAHLNYVTSLQRGTRTLPQNKQHYNLDNVNSP